MDRRIRFNNQKRIRINNQITAREVRVVDEDGNNFGVLSVSAALDLAREKEIDLIEISPTANPPVCKLMDYGKFLYIEKRKTKKKPAHQSTVREVRISLRISDHDLEIKAKKAEDFLKDGDKVKIDMPLKGREKYLDKKFLEERFRRILALIEEEFKISDGPKNSPRGFTMIVEKV